MKNKTLFQKIITTFLSLIVMAMVLSAPLRVLGDEPGIGTAVRTSDGGSLWGILTDTAENLGAWAKEWAGQQYEYLRDQGFALAYKKALAYFLNTLAKDTATYLVTGKKGQSPMFHTESWGEYLKNVGDSAVGVFLEELGKGGPIRFNLCDPGLPVLMDIGFGIMQTKRPRQPDCTFTQMKKNWQAELERPDFLSRFVDIYSYRSNDFGITLSLYSEVIESEALDTKLAEISRSSNDGFKDVTDSISGAIKTPANIVRSYTDSVVKKSGENYFTYTGHILADAIDVFTNTLVSKLLEKWLKKGLAKSSYNTSYSGSWGGFTSGGGSLSGGGGGASSGSNGLTNYEADNSSSGGISQAKKDFESFVAPNFAVKGDYNALNELVSCANPVKAGPNECVITDNFRQAVDNRMSVGGAAVSGFLNKDGVFGFKTDGLEPSYNEGLPYRSMIILRKLRIIPVGWELAAQFIMDNQDTLHRSFNLMDMIACFDSTDNYEGYTEKWCEGLVDPSWVLKSPLNYCKREGPGPQIISSQVTGTKEDSKLMVMRDGNYCADEQTCIKENSDGSCETYGYCTEDRRKYNFDGESCDPTFNTCESFRSSDGRTIGFLENTLDYGTSSSTCSAENAGCEMYKRSISFEDGAFYATSSGQIDWVGVSGHIALDATAEECEADLEGCHEFIRTKGGIGSNLLSNPGFEEIENLSSTWGDIGTISTDSKEGFSALTLTAEINRDVVISPMFGTSTVEYDLGGNIFTLSLYARNCGNTATLSLNGVSVSMEANDWRFLVVTKTFDAGELGNTLEIRTTNATNCTVDAIKLERSTPEAEGSATQYVPYRGVGLVYEKLLPNYLYDKCYVDSNDDGFIEKIKDSPLVCDDYARPCTANEVNCELYKSASDGMEIPAVVGASDYCPDECVGFDEYIQTETSFENTAQKFFIPETAEICSAEEKGCDEFTNLDELDDPEAREYYIHLRKCVDSTAPTCQPFFMWEGSDESGYQLKIHRLNTIDGSTIDTADGPSGCSIDIANPMYDADCREYYDADGAPFYELDYNTVSCTDECHSYRRTAEDETEENCSSHGGVWTDGSVCVYRGVPSEGVSCSAESAGCREFNGNAGANTRILFQNTFENGTNESWAGGVNSNASVIVGQHSLYIESSAYYTLGADLIQGKSYVLEFLAGGALGGGSIDSIYFENVETGEISQSLISSTTLTESWQSFELNLANLEHEIDLVNERLVINGKLYIDNIELTEVTDRYYAIEESWNDNCDHVDADLAKPLWEDKGHYAGCSAYTDRGKLVHNLFQFDHLCTDEAVGCELLIDTHNYSDYKQGIWFDSNGNGACDADEPDCVLVPADNYAFVVYDRTKSCNKLDKGCEKMGLEYRYEYPDDNDYKQYTDTFIFNNPDKYNEALCQNDTVGCKAWESSKGNSYFKDPVDMACEWRIETDLGIGQWGWFKEQVKRCDENGDGKIASGNPAGALQATEKQICGNASACELASATMDSPTNCVKDEDCFGSSVCVKNECRQDCILDTTDYPCETDNNGIYPPKTFGFGGAGNKVSQPLGDIEGKNWVAICPSAQDTCTEYADPQSTFSFDVDTLKPYTLYIAASDSDLPACADGNVYFFDNSINNFDNLAIAPVGDDSSAGYLFYYATSTDCRFDADAFTIRQAVVDYQLERTLDKTTCNGMVDLEQGCMLLNERSREGSSGMKKLTYNADIAYYNVPSSPSTEAPLDTNMLLKVSPDRVCNTWLSCRSFIKDSSGNDVCYDIGLCERFDDNGNCSYFSDTTTKVGNQIYPESVGLDGISNMTGYSRIGYGEDNSLHSDYYPLGEMLQVGQLGNVPNGSFERYDDSMYPIGWTPGGIDEEGIGEGDENWERDIFRVVNNPVDAQKEKIEYPVDGKAFLKFGAKNSVRSEPINLSQGLDYTLTFYINTMNLARGTAVFSSTIGAPNRSINRSKDWEQVFINFKANGNLNGRLKFQTLDGDGNVFVDKVEIKPTLNSKEDWRTPQSCRLYPENSSLSCDYLDDSGHRKYGWLGYCLEHDRYPGDPNACLMWYPIDRVNGDGISEGGGYIDRTPLYYCVATEGYEYGTGGYTDPTADASETETFVDGNNFGAHTSGDIDIIHRNPFGTSSDEWTLDQLGLGDIDEKWLLWENIDHIRIRHTSPSVTCDGNLSDAWDKYYRFTEDSLGGDCMPIFDKHQDCQPWDTPHAGGRKTESANFLDQNWHDVCLTDLGDSDCSDDDYDKLAFDGGLRVLSDGTSFTGLYTSNYDVYCDHPDYHIVEVVIFPKVFYCKDVIQTVTPMGQNQYYSANVYEGSEKVYPCNGGISTAEYTQCDYMSDLAPFGAVSQPGREEQNWSVMSNPYMWDSREGTDLNQPLFYEIPSGSMFDDSQARMGQGWDKSTVLNNLFAKSYGLWSFTTSGADGIAQVSGHYTSSGGAEAVTDANIPIVNNIKTIPSVGSIYANQLVNLKFNTDVHENHLPLIMYTVNWGDGTYTSVSGMEMRDRPEAAKPHTMYHIYSKSSTSAGFPDGYPLTIKIRDNWQLESIETGISVIVKELFN